MRKKIMCEALQIREIFMFEKRISMPTKGLIQKREISRKKRQGIAVAGIVGYVGSELINHFMSNQSVCITVAATLGLLKM